MRMTLGLLVQLTAGCGEANERFGEAFDEKFSASCVSSATQGGVPSDIATKACDCSLAKINEQFSASDKLTMSAQEAQPIMVACLSQAVKP